MAPCCSFPRSLAHPPPPPIAFVQTFGTGADMVKVYHHFAYKIEPRPPFRVCGVSKEINLLTRKPEKKGDWTHQRIWKDTSQTAYIAGLYLDEEYVLMSYGSSDIDARLLTLRIDELEALFPAPMDCSTSQLLSVPEGFTAPDPDSIAGDPAQEDAGGSSDDSGAGGAGGGKSMFQVEPAQTLWQSGARRRFAYRRHRRSHHRD